MRAHDPLSYIDPRSRTFNGLNMPIPVPMLMPAAPPQPAFFNSNGQMMNPNAPGMKSKTGNKKFNPAPNKKSNRAPWFQQNTASQGSSFIQSQQPNSQNFFKNGTNQTQNSHDISQGFSQNLLTQGPLSQGFLSQPGLSQAEFSQVC